MQRANLVPRALFPLTSSRKTIPLGATISGMRIHAVNRITKIPLLFQNGCSHSSRFPTAGQGERNSGNKIDRELDNKVLCTHCRPMMTIYYYLFGNHQTSHSVLSSFHHNFDMFINNYQQQVIAFFGEKRSGIKPKHSQNTKIQQELSLLIQERTPGQKSTHLTHFQAIAY